VNLAGVVELDPPYTQINQTNGLGRGYPFFSTSATVMTPVQNSNTLRPYNLVVTNVGANFSRVVVPGVIAATSPISYLAANTVVGAVVSTNYYLQPTLGANCSATYGAYPLFVPPAGESIVSFSYSNDAFATPYTLTTTFLAEQFLTGEFQIGSNEAVLCQLSSRNTGLPIAFIKICFSGIITSNAQVTPVTFDFRDVSLQFVSYIQGSQPIPRLTQAMLQSIQSVRLSALLDRTRQLHLGD
jgi:hypothetical protein